MYFNTFYVSTSDLILMIFSVIMFLILVAVICLIVAFLRGKKKVVTDDSKSSDPLKSLLDFQSQISASITQMRDKVDERLEKINEKMSDNLNKNEAKTQENIVNLKTEITKVITAQQQISNMEQTVNSLCKTLEGNQSRGQFGERMLHFVLENAFINNTKFFDEQHTLKIKDEILRPDAVVFAPDPYRLICIDSKFPFQNYSKLILESEVNGDENLLKQFKKDLKEHINKVSRYIIEGETADFAFLFIPNEAIYIYVHNLCSEIVDYADSKHIILCSPSSLYPFLSTILSINIDYQRREHIDDIMKGLIDIRKTFDNLLFSWNNLLTTYSTFNRKIEDFDKSIKKTSSTLKSLDSFVDDEVINVD